MYNGRENKGIEMKIQYLMLAIIVLFLVGCTADKTRQVTINQTEHQLQQGKASVAVENETKQELTKNEAEDISEQVEEAREEPVIEEKEIKESENKLIMIHNNKGPMCLQQLEFLDTIEKCPSLMIEEYFTYNAGTYELLSQLTSQFKASEGISASFEYLPITFINNHAYSGFNDEVKEKLKADIKDVCR